MIQFKSISFRNFLSYGNTLTTYDFTPGITRIRGENGAGKSSCVVDTVCFALFGKTYRRKQKLEQLINTTNKKKLEVYLTFSIGPDVYRVERGLKPSFFRIFKNDEIVEAPSTNRTYQQLLEDEIICLNEEVFDQTVIKSMAKNMSFLALKKSDKRSIVDSILGIEIFTAMNKLARNRVAEMQFEVSTAKNEITHNTKMIEAEMANLEKLKSIKRKVTKEAKRRVKEIEAKMLELQDKLKQCDEGDAKIAKNRERAAALEADIAAAKEANKDSKKALAEAEADILVSQRKLDMFKEMCPSCPRVREIEEGENMGENLMLVASLQESIKCRTEEVTALNERLSKCNRIIANEAFIRNTRNDANTQIAALNAELASINSDVVEIDETKLREYEAAKVDAENTYNYLCNTKRHLEVIRMLLSDDGIKTFIIKRYLPHINKILNTYLQKFNADILFYFDTEFEEIIGSRNKETFNYFSFSEGQKRRIDLAVLFTFLEFCKIKNRKAESNLLVLDEITAGVDGVGENMLYDILRGIVAKEGKEIITVSHSGNIDSDKIDRVYDVNMVNGFSVITQSEK